MSNFIMLSVVRLSVMAPRRLLSSLVIGVLTKGCMRRTERKRYTHREEGETKRQKNGQRDRNELKWG